MSLTYLPFPDFLALWAASQAGRAGEVNHGQRPTPAGIVIPHSAVNLPDHMDFDPRCTSGLVAISITPIRYSACLTLGYVVPSRRGSVRHRDGVRSTISS